MNETCSKQLWVKALGHMNSSDRLSSSQTLAKGCLTVAMESEASGVHPDLEEIKARVEARPVCTYVAIDFRSCPNDPNMIP